MLDPLTINRLIGRFPTPRRDLIVLAMKAHGKSWIWTFSDGRQDDVRRSAIAMADNKALAFDWQDAQTVSTKLRQSEDYNCGGK